MQRTGCEQQKKGKKRLSRLNHVMNREKHEKEPLLHGLGINTIKETFMVKKKITTAEQALAGG